MKKVLTKKGKERDAGLRLKLEPNVLSVEKTLKALEPKMLEFEDVKNWDIVRLIDHTSFYPA